MMSRGSTWSKPYNVSTNILHFHVVWVLVFHCSKCVCHILVVPYPPNNCNHHQPSMLGCHKIIGFPMKKQRLKVLDLGFPHIFRNTKISMASPSSPHNLGSFYWGYFILYWLYIPISGWINHVNAPTFGDISYLLGSKHSIWLMLIHVIIGILISAYINSYYWIDDHPRPSPYKSENRNGYGIILTPRSSRLPQTIRQLRGHQGRKLGRAKVCESTARTSAPFWGDMACDLIGWGQSIYGIDICIYALSSESCILYYIQKHIYIYTHMCTYIYKYLYV
jgi:hypothetical protein